MKTLSWIFAFVLATCCSHADFIDDLQRRKRSAECSAEYEALRADHTMCLMDRGTNVEVTAAVIRKVVRKHNTIRSAVSPPAADMQKLKWDDNLAAVAAKWARQCNIKHDTDKRDEPALPGVYIGQNIGAGYSSIVDAIKGWNAEIDNFQYGTVTGMTVGHYTQIVFAETTRVGCGMADCTGVSPTYKYFQVCNYAVGQNGPNTASEPYKKSEKSCSDCLKCVARDTLCACRGKVCYNGGKLNPTTCKCDCPSAFSGKLCETKNCPADTDWKCEIYFGDPVKYTDDPCAAFTNVRTEDCPHRCGFC